MLFYRIQAMYIGLFTFMYKPPNLHVPIQYSPCLQMDWDPYSHQMYMKLAGIPRHILLVVWWW